MVKIFCNSNRYPNNQSSSTHRSLSTLMITDEMGAESTKWIDNDDDQDSGRVHIVEAPRPIDVGGHSVGREFAQPVVVGFQL